MANKNTYYTVYGINSAKAVLKSNNCRIKDIYIDENNSLASKDEEICELISGIHSRCYRREAQEDFPNIGERTQGIVISFEFLGIKDSISDFLSSPPELLSNHPDSIYNECIVILDQLQDPQNLGQIIRTCECFGVHKIILTQNKTVKLSDSVFRVSQGAFAAMSFYVCNNLRNTLKILKEKKYWLVALENSIDAENWYEIDLKGNIGIILGSEGRGIRRLTLEDSDFKATIPMQGEVDSLNVSATCAAILSERLRQISD